MAVPAKGEKGKMMTEEYKHTALPWFAQEHDENGDLGYKEHYIEAGGYLICDEICNPHDAAFIGRACNSHYELLEALKELSSHLCTFSVILREDGKKDIAIFMEDYLINDLAKAKKAIAKATGES